MKHLPLFLSLAPILLKAEALLDTTTLASTETIDIQSKPTDRAHFFQIDPLSFSVGVGIRNRIEEGLKGREHSIRYTPGFSKDMWGIVTYKYSRLLYKNELPSSNYTGVGFKLGAIAHHLPYADVQYIKGWQYESGPFKWGQLEINCLPLSFAVYGAGRFVFEERFLDYSLGKAMFSAILYAAISFSLGF